MNPISMLLQKYNIYIMKKKLFSLSDSEKLKYISDLLKHFYQFDDVLTDDFYYFVLKEIYQGNLEVFDKENIFQVIDEYKGLSLYEDGLDFIITSKQYLEIPVKNINKLRTLLLDKMHTCPKNRLDYLYQNEDIYKLSRQTHFLDLECTYFAYKLYLSMGFTNSLELLQDKYGEVSFATLYFWMYPIDVTKISVPNEELTTFLFGGEKENSAMASILNGSSKELYLNFSYFYQNFFYYYKELQGNVSRKRVEALLKDRFLTFDPVYPNIKRDVVDDMIKSFHNKYIYNDYSDKQIENLNYAFYEENISHQISSSIPQIQIFNGDYKASILAKNDPKVLVMGYRANNCFRLNGDASVLFKKVIASKHCRVVSVSRAKDNDIAMAIIIRNGNVIVAQGIEISQSYQNIVDRKKIYLTIEKFMKQLMNEMNEKGDVIVATMIGCSNSNVSDFNSKFLPFRVTPILNGDQFSTYYDGFHFPQCLISMKENTSLGDIKLFTPTFEYFDQREEVLCLKPNDYSYVRNLVNQRLMAISYFADTQMRRIRMQSVHEAKEIYCNSDWYLIVFEDGEIEGTYLDKDPRAKEEYEFSLSRVKNSKLK